MGTSWGIFWIDVALIAVFAAASVIAPEVAAAGGVLKTIQGVIRGADVIRFGAVMLGGSLTLASAIASEHETPYYERDPFDSPPPKKPRPSSPSDTHTDTGTHTDGKVPENGGDTHTETETEKDNTPLVRPVHRGDYAGIQKTMYDPITGNILGLKFLTRTHRGSIHSNFRHVSHVLRRTGARVYSVKPTHRSPVRPHGQIWDSAFRP